MSEERRKQYEKLKNEKKKTEKRRKEQKKRIEELRKEKLEIDARKLNAIKSAAKQKEDKKSTNKNNPDTVIRFKVNGSNKLGKFKPDTNLLELHQYVATTFFNVASDDNIKEFDFELIQSLPRKIYKPLVDQTLKSSGLSPRGALIVKNLVKNDDGKDDDDSKQKGNIGDFYYRTLLGKAKCKNYGNKELANIDELVKNDGIAVIVFYYNSITSLQTLIGNFEYLDEQIQDTICFGSINVENHKDLGMKYDIRRKMGPVVKVWKGSKLMEFEKKVTLSNLQKTLNDGGYIAGNGNNVGNAGNIVDDNDDVDMKIEKKENEFDKTDKIIKLQSDNIEPFTVLCKSSPGLGYEWMCHMNRADFKVEETFQPKDANMAIEHAKIGIDGTARFKFTKTDIEHKKVDGDDVLKFTYVRPWLQHLGDGIHDEFTIKLEFE